MTVYNFNDFEKKEIITELKKINPQDSAYLTLEVKNLIELRQHVGILYDKNFSFENKIEWAAAKLENEISVESLIALLEKKDILDLSSDDFKGCSILKTVDGNNSVSNLQWETSLTESEKIELENHDLEGESDINGTQLQFNPGNVDSMIIEYNNGK
jgi:hypothetical protein